MFLKEVASPEEIYNDFLEALSRATGLSKARLSGEVVGEMSDEERRVWEDTWRKTIYG